MIKRIIAKLRQMHKRKGFVLLLLAGVSTFVAITIVLLATVRLDLMARDRQIEFSFPRDENVYPVLGAGINISEIPKTNLLEYSSFEPFVFREAFDVLSGGDDSVVISNTEAKPGVYGEGFFVGASARINTYSSTGVVQKKTGTVLSYTPNLAGDFIRIPTIGDLPFEAKVNAYASKGDQVILAGDNGIVLVGANTQSPSIEYVGVNDDIICATSNSTHFFVITKSGLILSSIDGVTWDLWESPLETSINAISASDNALVAVGDDGVILTGYDMKMVKQELFLEENENLEDIVFDGEKFVIVTSRGKVITSKNAVIWEVLFENENNYKRIEYKDYTYILVTDDNKVEFYDNLKMPFINEHEFDFDVLDVALLSKSKVFFTGDDNILYESSDRGNTIIESRTVLPIRNAKIFANNDQEVLAALQFNNIYIAELVTEIVFDASLPTSPFQPGDICYLSIEYPYIPDSLLDTSIIKENNPWQHVGEGSANKEIRQGASSSGIGVMVLENDSRGEMEDYTIISQKIGYNDSQKRLIPGNFYQFSMWLRVDELSEDPVLAWISGPFESIGIEFNNVGTTWKKYTFKFSFPKSISTAQSMMARFNIGIGNGKTLYIDNVYLGEVSQDNSEYDLVYKEVVNDINPSIVRLNNLNIGSFDYMPNRWAYTTELEEALNTVSQINENTTPWIVIDSAISESELRNLIEYLSGSITTIYGRQRLENGSSIPWISRFNRIYFEFIDSHDLLRNDAIRSVYVNNLIDIVSSTPYYNDNRNKITFIDGTNYTDGIMLSRADYNATDLYCKVINGAKESIDLSIGEYKSLIPRTPDRPSLIPYNIIREINISHSLNDITTAGVTVLMLELLGNDSGAPLLTLPPNIRKENQQMIQAAKVASIAVGGEYLELVSSLGISEEIYVKGYAFRNAEKLTLVFASLTDSPASILLNIPQSLQGAQITKIDSTGINVDVSHIRSSTKRETILPGQVIVIEIGE